MTDSPSALAQGSLRCVASPSLASYDPCPWQYVIVYSFVNRVGVWDHEDLIADDEDACKNVFAQCKADAKQRRKLEDDKFRIDVFQKVSERFTPGP